MSGPIVRTGTTPKFWANWDKAFGAQEEDKKSEGKGTAKKATRAKKKSGKKKSGK